MWNMTNTYTADEAEDFEPRPCALCGREDAEVEWIDVGTRKNPGTWIPRVVCACGAVNDGYWRYPR